MLRGAWLVNEFFGHSADMKGKRSNVFLIDLCKYLNTLEIMVPAGGFEPPTY
jgi:hypothetical protein